MSRSGKVSVSPDVEVLLQPILRSVDYVEKHIHERIRVGDMASIAGYSVFHFCRVFNTVTGHSPYDYQMKRKLSEALQYLQSGDLSVTRAALDFGFETVEGFSRAFKKMFGMLPSDLKCGGLPDARFLLEPLSCRYISDLNGCNTTPRWADYSATELSGITDHHTSVTESVARSQFTDGLVVLDYHRGWESRGAQIFLETPGDFTLKTVVASGSYAAFSPDCSALKIDSFLRYFFSVFCRRAGDFLPDRIVLDIRNGIVREVRTSMPAQG